MKKNENVRISDEKKRLLLASAVIATGAVCYLFLKKCGKKIYLKNKNLASLFY
jgi:hypothetical protein